RRILLHLQCARGHTSRVGSLPGSVSDSRFEEDFNAFGSCRHVGAFSYSNTSVFDKCGCILSSEFVLSRARQRYITFNLPNFSAGLVASMLSCVAIPFER